MKPPDRQDASLELLVVGPEGARKATEFRNYIQERGRSVDLLYLNSRLSDVAKLNPRGVVVFDEKNEATEEWLKKIRDVTRYLETPLVAMTDLETTGAQESLMAAGASVVLARDEPFDKILEVMTDRIKVQSVLLTLQDNLLTPFSSATTLTFKEMANMDLKVLSTYQKTGYKMFGDISAVIGLMSTSMGSMVVSFPAESARLLAKNILGNLAPELDENLIRDCVGEFANVIAGQARGLLSESPYQFEMSTPTVIAGTGHEIRHKPGNPCLVVAFGSELGDFALQICMGP